MSEEPEYILLECPFCEGKQKQKFKDGRTVDLYCHCNVNAYMYLSLKKDQYIQYGYMVSKFTELYILQELTKIKKEKDDKQ